MMRPWLLPLLLLLAPACGGDSAAPRSDTADSAADVAGDGSDSTPDATETDSCEEDRVFGERSLSRIGGVVVFSELSLDPPWVELQNQQAIDVDLSGWRFDGSTQYTFPAGTFIDAGKPLVVQLSGDPSTLRLYNNAGRLMDSLAFTGREPWPALAEGFTLEKKHPDLSSFPPESWVVSAASGGTAGSVRRDPAPPPDPHTSGDVVINEIMYHPPGEGSDWIELHNRGTEPAYLYNWQLADATAHAFQTRDVIAPDGYLVLASDIDAFRNDYPDALAIELGGELANGGERIALYDRCSNLVDVVTYADGGRWHDYADGGGSSLELLDPRADNAQPEAWAASDESARGAWQEIRYRAAATASRVGPDGQWEEFVMGLLDGGEVLVDDVRVVEDPDGAARELIGNGDFSDGASAWRILGTHASSRVEPDPDDAANQVLHIVASGPTEHMHNQVATTLAAPIENGTTYEISLRARRVAGSGLLNTRLYFNRLARTTRLTPPAGGGTPDQPNRARVPNLGPTISGLGHDPVVPRPGEAVTVTAHVSDPDGVAAVVLAASVDGAAPLSIPMSAVADERYQATVPGQAKGAIVQLRVEARDSAEAASTFPATGNALYPVDDPPPAGELPALRIVMTRADSERFHALTEIMSNALVPVTVIYGDRDVFYHSGVRAKGSQRGRPEDARLGFSLRFDATERFRGVFDSVAVDRSEGLHTGQRELFLDVAMAHAGSVSAEYNDLVYLFAPRAVHDGHALLQTARFSDVMLDNQFEDGASGNLYEYELIYYPTTTVDGTPDGLKLPLPDEVLGTPIADLGNDPEAYRHNFLLENNRAEDDFSPLITFAKALAGGFSQEIEPLMDSDQWLRAFAFMTLSGAVDHYGAGGQHNAQLYVRPSDGRFLLFPHDLDFFGDPLQDLIIAPDLKVLLRRGRRAFYQHLHEIITSTYNGAYLARWRDHLQSLLPEQDFSKAFDEMVQRADWIMHGAPDAVSAIYPEAAFDIALPSFEGTPGSVPIEGAGWIDIDTIWLVDPEPAVALPLTWVDDVRWRVTLDLPAGVHNLELEARDRRGNAVGSDTITLTLWQ